jgi:hypothetical protein
MAARFIIIIISISILLISCSDENTSGPVIEPEGLIDIVTVGSDSVQAQMKFSIDVVVENKEELSGLVVPLGFTGENFSIDSISFIGSRFDIGDLSGAEIYPDDNKIIFWHYPEAGEAIDSGSGTAFKVYLWVWGNAPTQNIVIDTTTINTSVKLGYTDLEYNYYVPEFERGIIHVDGIQTAAMHKESSISKIH